MAGELLSAGIGAVGAIIGGLIQVSAKWWNRPKLKLDFVGNEANRTEGIFTLNGREIVQIYLRARLRNKGRRVARNCSVYLVGIVKVLPGGTAPTKYHDAMPLTWPGSPRDRKPRDLPKGIEAYVDVVSVRKNEPSWHFHIRELLGDPQAVQSLTSYKGTFRLTLVATADDAKPRTLSFDVYHDGDWRNLRAQTSPARRGWRSWWSRATRVVYHRNA
jgi:hypothetical protein